MAFNNEVAKFLVQDFGSIRAAARSMGIPYSTLQSYASRGTNISPKWESTLDTFYNGRVNYLTKDLPTGLKGEFREMAKDSPKTFREERANWEVVLKEIQRQRYEGYERIHASALKKQQNGLPLTPQEALALKQGLGEAGRKADERWLWEALNNMDQGWDELWETYGDL